MTNKNKESLLSIKDSQNVSINYNETNNKLVLPGWRLGKNAAIIVASLLMVCFAAYVDYKSVDSTTAFNIKVFTDLLHANLRSFGCHFNKSLNNGIPCNETPSLVVHNFYYESRSFPFYSHPLKPHYNNASLSNQTTSMEKFHANGVRHVMLVAGPGAGKSNLLRTYSRKIINGEIATMKNIEVVVFLRGSALNFEYATTAQELFVENLVPDLNKHHAEYAFKWMRDNQEKCLIVIDSLDQITAWNFELVQREINYKTKAKVSEIIYNLFTGNLFNGSKILTASREHAIFTINKSARPSKIIALTGFHGETVDRLLKQISGNNVEKLRTLKDTNLALYSLCRTPMFLVFITQLLKDHNIVLSDTSSGIMMYVLFNLLQSSHCCKGHGQNSVSKTFSRMQKLAYVGMEMGRVLFNKDDLESTHINSENLCLMTTTTVSCFNNDVESTHIAEERIFYYFLHQSLMEAMAATYIVKHLSKDEFDQYLTEMLFNPRYFEVNKMLTGIIFNPDTMKVSRHLFHNLGQLRPGEKLDLSEQKASMIDSFSARAKLGTDFYLVSLLHQAGNGADDFIKKNVNAIVINEAPMDDYQFYIVGNVINKCSTLQSFKLKQNSLTHRQVDKLHKYLTLKHTKIVKLILHVVDFENAKSLLLIASLVHLKNVEELDLSICNLSIAHLESLLVGFSKYKIMLNRLNFKDFENDSKEKKFVEQFSKHVCQN